jgi:hypothetical protein
VGVGLGAGIVLAMAASKTKLEMQLGSRILNSSAPQVEGTRQHSDRCVVTEIGTQREELNCGFEFGCAPGARAAVFCVRTFLA